MHFFILICGILLDMESRMTPLFVEERNSIICRQIAIIIIKM
jgi:hypothetical protein